MQCQVIPITGETIDPFGGGKVTMNARLELYLSDCFPLPNGTRRLVLICPGGGYTMVSPRCGEPIALAFAGAGFHAAVLRYTVAPDGYFPAQLLELAHAVALIRTHVAEWRCDPDGIILCGFSAGGHLAASYATLWTQPFLCEQQGLSRQLLRPNGVILGYPVISSGRYAHRPSFDNLLGDRREDAALLELLSAQRQVGADTPPMFLWHTVQDQAVPVQNSIEMAAALAEHHIPFELHIFPRGGHGLALCDERTAVGPGNLQPEAAVWLDLAIRWAKELGQ